MKHPELSCMFTCPQPPIGDERRMKHARREGIREGAPTIVLPLRVRESSGLYIWFVAKGSALTKRQRMMMIAIEKAGGRTAVARSVADAVRLVAIYAGLPVPIEYRMLPTEVGNG